MKFVLSNSSLFVVVAVSISSFIVTTVPGVHAEFHNNNNNQHHEFTKKAHAKKEDLAAMASVTTSNTKEQEENNHDDRHRKLFRGAATAAVPPPPRPHSASYDSYSYSTATNTANTNNHGHSGPQSFEKHYTGITTSGMEVANCRNVEIEVKSNVNEPGMTIQIVAPNDDNSVTLDNPDVGDIDVEQEGLEAGETFEASDNCVKFSTDCYIFIVRDSAGVGFLNGSAKIKISGREVYTITNREVVCRFGVQCGDANGPQVAFGDTKTLTFDNAYEYAAIGACEFT